MARRRYSEEEIIKHLRTMELAQAKGQTIEEFSRTIGVHPVTLAKWKKKYGGMGVSDAKKLKDLEKENARLKRLLADAELDKAALKEVIGGNY